VAKIVFKSSYLLSPGQVHVYYALIDRPPEEIEAFGRLLSQEELARAKRFKNSINRQRYLVRQGILRELLAGYLDCDPARIEIHRDANGKPSPASRMNPDLLQFSDSHSENMAAFAFGLQNRLGVDIEKIRELTEMLDIVKGQFASRENQAVLNCPEDRRLDLFYRFWTRKEAVLKAQGEGLLMPLDSVDVSEGGEGQPFKVTVLKEKKAEVFWVRDIQAPLGFAAAIASDRALGEISIFSK
jgi:4'-phosphopantetheinyl transferase